MEKFYFNPNTLKYHKIEKSRRQKLLNLGNFLLLVLVFSALIFKLSEDIVQSPKHKRMVATKHQLAYEIELLNRDILRYDKILDHIEYNDDHLYRVYFEVDPVPGSKRDAGSGGSNRYSSLSNYPYSDLLTETFVNLDDISRKLVIQSKSFDEVIDLAKHKEQIMAARPAIQPVSMKDLIRFGSAFGIRLHPILKVVRPHNGIDLTAPRGTSIYATADGVVVQAAYTTGGYGRKILIDHGFGYKTLYGHCNQILVEKGQKVKRGEVIGLVGSTGLSTTPHLHYEVWVNNRPVNPINYYANDLSPEEYEKMIGLFSKADPSFDIN